MSVTTDLLKVPESIRTRSKDIFHENEIGFMPKEGVENYKGKVYNFREAVMQEAAGLDTTTMVQDLKYLIPEVMNRHIITEVENARIAINLVDTMKVNVPAVSYLKEFGFEASIVPETGEVPVGKLRHEKFNIYILKVGIRPNLSYESIADGKVDIFRRNVDQCSVALARFQDKHILAVLNGGVPNGSTIPGTKESNHSFAAAGNLLTWDDWVNATMAIQLEGLKATDVVMHPYQAAQILKLPEYRDYTNTSQWTLTSARIEKILSTGQLPPILGLRLWVTQNQTPGVMLFVDKMNYGILAIRQPVLVEAENDIVRQMKTVVFTERYGCNILNNDGASNITGLKTTLV